MSSKMFTGIMDLYKEDFKVILIDFLGHGNSDRLEQFHSDFWYDQAMQVIPLITPNHYDRVNLIGTSGCALAALNVALERSDLVHKVIADSFEGEQAVSSWAGTISAQREKTKTMEQVCMLWEYCHGKDWERVVDLDTDVVIRHAKTINNFFHHDLSQLTIPAMLSVSLKDDEYIGIMDIEKTYKELMKKIPKGILHLFPSGGHPAMLTNAKEFADLAKDFFRD